MENVSGVRSAPQCSRSEETETFLVFFSPL